METLPSRLGRPTRSLRKNYPLDRHPYCVNDGFFLDEIGSGRLVCEDDALRQYGIQCLQGSQSVRKSSSSLRAGIVVKVTGDDRRSGRPILQGGMEAIRGFGSPPGIVVGRQRREALGS
jgi:hypothetical protein